MQAALTLEEVQRTVLGWDYHSLVSGAVALEKKKAVGRVPVAFADLQHYCGLFSGLVLEELKAHVQKACSAACKYRDMMSYRLGYSGYRIVIIQC